MWLPEPFLKRMEKMLGGEFAAFLAAFDAPHRRGVRLNPLKCDEETLFGALPFPKEPAPFSPLSFYAPAGIRMSSLPLYHAGAFYAQEPSASSAVTLLDPQPGERVLDLCAAPGGKSTQIAALTGDRGLLWANEIVPNRAEVLASNLERMGVRNAVISSVKPEQLAGRFAGFFDRVLVDAPCSGEGMFRRDEEAVAAWSEAHVVSCAARQLAILRDAAVCVRPGGTLVYSTCTFSEEENEGVVRAFLEEHPDFTAEEPQVSFGRPAYGIPGVRIFPMDGGEGHFAARFRRAGGEPPASYVPHNAAIDRETEKLARALWEELFADEPGSFARVGNRILLLPEILPALSGLRILRAGVEFAEVKKNRLEPAHGIFMAHRAEDCRSVLRLTNGDPAVRAFLRGEEISAPMQRGYTAVAVGAVVTGFGKASNDMLKNRYPKGLRAAKL